MSVSVAVRDQQGLFHVLRKLLGLEESKEDDRENLCATSLFPLPTHFFVAELVFDV